MSDFTDILEKGPRAAKVALSTLDPSQEGDYTNEEKKKPGRPRKEAQRSNAKESSDKVCYVTPSTKTTIKKIQAAQILSSGRTLTSSEIITAALNLYIKHNKLDIN